MLFSLFLQLLEGVKEYILIPAQLLHLIQHKDMIDLPSHVHLQLAGRVLVEAFVSPHLLLLSDIDVLANRPQQILDGLEHQRLKETLQRLLPVGVADNKNAPVLYHLG